MRGLSRRWSISEHHQPRHSDTSATTRAPLVHSFYPEWFPDAHHRSDQDFFDHIRKIFKLVSIDYQGEISNYDRFLCPSDFEPGNFRKTTTPDGRWLVVLDFRATCFMPLPFIEVALEKDRDDFR